MLQAPSLEPVTHLRGPFFFENYSLPSCVQMPSGAAYIWASPLPVNPAQQCLFAASNDALLQTTFQFALHCCLPSSPSVISETAECGISLSVHPLPAGLSDQVYLTASSSTSTISASAHSLFSYIYI